MVAETGRGSQANLRLNNEVKDRKHGRCPGEISGAFIFLIFAAKIYRMIYRVIGTMSGSSLDGLDIVFAEIEETRGNWSFKIINSECSEYDHEWKSKLQNAIHLNAKEYVLLHTSYGRYTGEKINEFIEKHSLQHKVQLIGNHGHTTFHIPEQNTTAQIGDGASIAALTGINTVTDLRSMDVALGGQGAPLVPVGEKLLFPGYDFYLNIGGITNISFLGKKENEPGSHYAFDICPANRVLNMLAQTAGKEYDDKGEMAASGNINDELLAKLNALDYYQQLYPKSLANDFGTDIIFPLIQSFNLNVNDALRTYTEHIAIQLHHSIKNVFDSGVNKNESDVCRMMVTGGGAFNTFLISRIQDILQPLHTEIILPDEEIIKYKEALIMALLAVLRWREENTAMHTLTGAVRSSIGGAVWIGQEA